MVSLTLHVEASTHAMLQEIAEASGETVAQVVDEAVRDDRRKRFWAEHESSYARLRADPAASAEFDRETSAWDASLDDGLKADRGLAAHVRVAADEGGLTKPSLIMADQVRTVEKADWSGGGAWSVPRR